MASTASSSGSTPAAKPSPLVRRTLVAHPLPHQSLFFRVSRVEFDDGLLRPFAASAKVGMESPKRLERNISRDAAVALRIELEPAALCGDHAAPPVGDGCTSARWVVSRRNDSATCVRQLRVTSCRADR